MSPKTAKGDIVSDASPPTDVPAPPLEGNGGPPGGGRPGRGGADQDGEERFQMGGVGKHALIYGGGVLLSKALAFVMLPVYTHFLSPADYGIMGLIEMTLDVIAIMAGPQLAPAIFRFYHKAESEGERADVVSTALILLGVSYTLVGLTAFLTAPLLSSLVFDTAQHTGLVRLASANMIFESLMIVPLAFAQVEDRSKLFVGANAVKLALSAGLNVFFLAVMDMGVAGVFLSTLITRVLVGSFLTAWVVRSVGLRFSLEKVRVLLRYGIPLVGTQFATFAATFGDRYFLQHHADEATVGLYNLAYQFGFLLSMVGFIPFDKVWGPKRFHLAQRKDSDDLLARGFIYANLCILTVGTGITLFVGDVLSIMTAPPFHGAATLVPIILVAYVLQSWAGTQDIGILIREKTEYVTLANWVAAGVALLAYWLLIPRLHGLGAALGTVIAFAVRYGLTYLFSQKLWRVEYRWRPVLRLLFVAGAISVAGLLIDVEPLWLSLLTRTGLFACYLAGVWYGGILSDEEREAFLRWTKSIVGQLWRFIARRRAPSGASSPAPGAD